jgi:Tol biopolymer transport system component
VARHLLLVLALCLLVGCGGGSTPTPGLVATPTVAAEAVPATMTAEALAPSDTPEPATSSSVCRGRIAFVARTDDGQDLFVISADGSGLVNVTNGGGREDAPSWSPDGTRILFSSHAGNSDIYTIQADGSSLVRLTDDPARDYAPSWSPDGTQVLFASTRVFASDLFVVSAQGGEAVALTGMGSHKMDFAWSPDGTPGGEQIAFTMLDGYNQGEVYVMAAPDEAGSPGGELVNLTEHPAHDCCVAWAPDGERLLFLSSRNGGGGGLLLGRRWFGNLYEDLYVREGRGNDSTTSPEVVRPLTTVVPKPPQGIWLIHRDGSGLTRLTNGAGIEREATWSPDGTQIAFVSDRDGNDEIYVLAVGEGTAAGSGEPVRLTDHPEDDRRPTWSPDGTCLAFESRRDGEWGLYVMNAGGSGLKKLAGSAGWGSSPSWSP